MIKKAPKSMPLLIQDIYDGEEYKRLAQPGRFLCRRTNPVNLSFNLSTDGVALFKSSHTEIWPLYLVVNELPPSVRY